jgi:hypothetical protein
MHRSLSAAGTGPSHDSTLGASASTRTNRPLVLIGPYAHHSSILPWCVACMVSVYRRCMRQCGQWAGDSEGKWASVGWYRGLG